MLRQRILTALIGLPGLVVLLGWGSFEVVQFFFLLCLGVSVFELSYMLQPRLDDLQIAFKSSDLRDGAAETAQEKRAAKTHDERKKSDLTFSAVLAVAAFLWAWSVIASPGLAGRGLVGVGFIFAMLSAIFVTRGIDAQMSRVFGATLALTYGAIPWLSVMDLYSMGSSGKYVFLLLIVVWCGDTGGYFGGRFFGKHKLAPHKSPKKTWEGSIAGLIASLVGALTYGWQMGPSLGSLPLVGFAAIATGIAGQLGDLTESVFKRFSKVKDSGAIFPGHGGFLDRTDALLTGAPVLWLVFYLAGVLGLN